jgi:hypothetical protein
MIICIFIKVIYDFKSSVAKEATRIYILYADEAAIQPKGIHKAKSVKSLLEHSGRSSRVCLSALHIRRERPPKVSTKRQRSLMGEKG